MTVIPSSQVNVIAVGVENYKFMPQLRGPRKDVERFVNLLSTSSKTGLYQSSQVLSLINPNSNQLRESINDLLITRSALGDVLIFYFSGHGVPIGTSDFGFCTIDAKIHDNTGSVLPLTVFRFRDLLDSLRVMNIIPIIIIDACYSGMVSNVLNLSSADAILNMKGEVSRQNAASYSLLCSCTDREASRENKNGGLFSQTIFDVLEEGFQTQDDEKSVIYIKDIFSKMEERVNSIYADSTPQLFLGETIPLVPIIKNSGYNPLRIKFLPYLKKIIVALWNNGNEIELTRNEILHQIGTGAYGNHNKLSCSGWALLETDKKNRKRRLTEKGKLFVQGNLTIPEEVVFDPNTHDYIAAPNARQIGIDSVRD